MPTLDWLDRDAAFRIADAVPANRRYGGRFRFAKHFYPVVANLKEGGEEHACAVAIDAHPRIRHRVRNLDSDPVAGFWLPTPGAPTPTSSAS